MYIFSPGELGRRFLEALVAAASRGVRVRVLLDALGSYSLDWSFWDSLRAAGGEIKQFNPLSLNRLGIRNHRKLLVCDERMAFVGGFNIAPEYEGDGVTCGWCDVGLKVEGPLSDQLARSFDEMFERADLQHRRFYRLRRSSAKQTVLAPNEQLLLSGPGRGRNPVRQALRLDLGRGKDVQIVMGYFLPSWSLRRQLGRVVRRGGRVRLVLAGKSDVALSQLAGQSLYRRLLRSGVEVYEYQPQVLHAKLIIADEAIYIGSSNLDPRSLNLNYELMVRLENPQIAAQARAVFENIARHSVPVTVDGWSRSRSLWRRLKQHWAYFVLVRVDPYIARRQWRALPD
jgi:cardiolipin synthase